GAGRRRSAMAEPCSPAAGADRMPDGDGQGHQTGRRTMQHRLNRRTAAAAGVAALLLALLAGVAVGRTRPSRAAATPAGAAREARDNAAAYAALWGRSHPDAPG